ncbi:DUF418 domain-containing protein [Stenotrophomonas oahuensis]|uniref:DUF418 domain-containing protein n=1 Tax=Stenotrophomonas oahuensis TaxID=3003271 RepID=A0ABY9YQM2_9GAMM|nr:DUF418 domain-containing protein [Stenotrophomonas sp. A5586]WNH52905.1 DUF418 domain-containing protein [Stenotrophomonas sp. A5586]
MARHYTPVPECPVNPVASSLQPVAVGDRIEVIDILRGVALLGILLMNMEALSGPLDLAFTGIDPHWQGADRWADALIYVLVQGKFFTLFSLLFGAGFAIMAQRAEAARRDFTPFYLRRSAGLLLIGLCHALLVWSGDILVLYALISLPLLAFREAPPRWLPVMGVITYLFASALMIGMGLLVGIAAQADSAMADAAAAGQRAIELQRQAYAHGSWTDAVLQRAHDLQVNLGGMLVVGPEVLGMFLIGAGFARSGALSDPERFPRLYRRLRWGAWPAGLVLMIISACWVPYVAPGTFSPASGFAYALSSVASLLMCLGYLAWIVHARAQLRVLAPIGRMALTQYILQSLVGTWVFYGYGLGAFESLPRLWQIPFALVLFALQVLFAHAWLRHFRFGPLEWVWRAMTYRRWPPLRRTAGTH